MYSGRCTLVVWCIVVGMHASVCLRSMSVCSMLFSCVNDDGKRIVDGDADNIISKVEYDF